MKGIHIYSNTPSLLEFISPNLTIYFSYDAVIAFWTPETGIRISENDWTRTTGKHIGMVRKQHMKSHDSLVKHEDFEKELTEVLKKHNLI